MVTGTSSHRIQYDQLPVGYSSKTHRFSEGTEQTDGQTDRWTLLNAAALVVVVIA